MKSETINKFICKCLCDEAERLRLKKPLQDEYIKSVDMSLFAPRYVSHVVESLRRFVVNVAHPVRNMLNGWWSCSGNIDYCWEKFNKNSEKLAWWVKVALDQRPEKCEDILEVIKGYCEGLIEAVEKHASFSYISYEDYSILPIRLMKVFKVVKFLKFFRATYCDTSWKIKDVSLRRAIFYPRYHAI